jgi:acetylornithine deacetylase
MFSRIVAEPSVSSVQPSIDTSNAGVVNSLAGWLEDVGFDVQLQPLSQRGKFNLIARTGPGSEGLLLSGHTDTVPYDEGLWHSDPFELTERDANWYGLGSSDMKCFFPLAIEACKRVDITQLKRPLTIVATADEESSMQGARQLSADLVRQCRYAVIGEPTGLAPVFMHKGVMMERVTLNGCSGHSSDPHLGNSALEGMYRVLGALLDWRNELQDRFHDEAFKVAVPTMNLGHIHGGDNPNRICANCELQLDLRPLPGMDIEELRSELRAVVHNALQDRGFAIEVAPIFPGVSAMATPRESAIVKAAEQVSGRLAGAVAFGTEGPFLNAMGMETVILGPGDIDIAHQPDEYVPIARLQPYVDILVGLIRRFCIEQHA